MSRMHATHPRVEDHDLAVRLAGVTVGALRKAAERGANSEDAASFPHAQQPLANGVCRPLSLSLQNSFQNT